MNKFAIAALMFLASCGMSPAFAWNANDPASILRQVEQTNVLVNDSCSGTIIDKEYILTANHCVDNQYRIVTKETIGNDGKVTREEYRVAVPGTVSQIRFKNSVEVVRHVYIFKVVDTDNVSDLALLKIGVPLSGDAMTAPIACSVPAVLSGVFAVGNPFGALINTITKGIINSFDRSYRDLQIAGQLGDLTDNGEHGLVQHSALIAPGNSGGALYNEIGELVGVNIRGGSGFAFAVPYTDVVTFLNRNSLEHLTARCNGQ